MRIERFPERTAELQEEGRHRLERFLVDNLARIEVELDLLGCEEVAVDLEPGDVECEQGRGILRLLQDPMNVRRGVLLDAVASEDVWVACDQEPVGLVPVLRRGVEDVDVPEAIASVEV